MKIHQPRNLARRQRGLVLVLVVVGLTSVLGMAGLALDFGLAFLVKSRIQNALDAAALSGAKVLKNTGSTTQATTDAGVALNYYLSQLNRDSITPTVQFSSTLVPFTPGSAPANFIRVRMPAGYTIPTYLTRVFGAGDTLTLAGSAVAGPIRLEPSGEVCNIAPIVVSAVPDASGSLDRDCTDGSCFGYTVGQAVDLKQGTSAGPGNFNLLRLGGSGGAVVRENLAGAYNGCATIGGSVETQTGVLNGPFQGIDTRFGRYTANLSQTDYPPDVNVNNYTAYSAYVGAVAGGTITHAPPTGVPGRRLIRVVFSDFSSGTYNGNSMVPASGVGCFFLKRPSQGGGNNQYISAEFTLDCALTAGIRTNTALDNLGEFFRIVLYKDPDSRES